MFTVLNYILSYSFLMQLWGYEQSWAGTEQGLIVQVSVYGDEVLAACPHANEYLLSKNSQSDDFSTSLFTIIMYTIIKPFSQLQ